MKISIRDNDMFELILSENAVDYTVNTATPIITLDFVGYLGILDSEKDKVLYLVDVDGNFELVSGDKNRPKLPRRLKRKWLKWCLNHRFLEYTIEPFQEYSKSFHLPFDETKA